MLQDTWKGLSDLLFPRNCIVCRNYIHRSPLPYLCRTCVTALPYNTPPFCLRCSRHLEVYREGGLCASCRRQDVAFDSAWAACRYTGVIRTLLHRYKYQNRTGIRKTCSRIIRRFVRRYRPDLSLYDVCLPMPLHRVRLRERGYNQCTLLAAEISQIYAIPMDINILARRRYTKSQTHLHRKERWTNLQGAFTINRISNIQGKNILLIDDLLTTGATASEAAAALKAAGAQSVGILTLAIAEDRRR